MWDIIWLRKDKLISGSVLLTIVFITAQWDQKGSLHLLFLQHLWKMLQLFQSDPEPTNPSELYNSTIIIPMEAVNCHCVSLLLSQAPLLFHPFFIPLQHSPSLTTFFKSQINTSKTTVITLNIVLALSQAVIIIIIPPYFLLHPGNYTQLFLNPVCCFLLLFLSIHLSLSFFSFSSLVCLSSLTLRLSLYLSLRWLLRRGNGWACWLKQDERPSKQKPLNRELNACPLLTRAHAYTRACENTVRDRDKTTCFQTDFCSLKKKQKKNVMLQEV